jgi:hypothetical protein
MQGPGTCTVPTERRLVLYFLACEVEILSELLVKSLNE